MPRQVAVFRGPPTSEEKETVKYERRPEGWYVKTPADGQYWKFAEPEMDGRTVRRRIKQKWCDRHGSADPFNRFEVA